MAPSKTWSSGRVATIWAAILIAPAPSLAADEHRPGESFRDCPQCPELVVVPAGTYLMGKDGGAKREGPAHRVTIASAFAIGKYEATFDEWEVCLEEGGCKVMISRPAPFGKREVSFAAWKTCQTDDECQVHPDDHKWGRGRRPVMNIKFRDAEDYVGWLSRKTGHTYRLPTEAEWEYVARGGTSTVYSGGPVHRRSATRHFPWGRTSLIRSAFSTCTETFGSGFRIAGTPAMWGPRRMARHAFPTPASTGRREADRGTTYQPTCAPHTAPASIPAPSATESARACCVNCPERRLSKPGAVRQKRSKRHGHFVARARAIWLKPPKSGWAWPSVPRPRFTHGNPIPGNRSGHMGCGAQISVFVGAGAPIYGPPPRCRLVVWIGRTVVAIGEQQPRVRYLSINGESPRTSISDDPWRR